MILIIDNVKICRLYHDIIMNDVSKAIVSLYFYIYPSPALSFIHLAVTDVHCGSGTV